MTPLDLIEQKLAAAGCHPRRQRGGLVARCPAHEDRNPSLSISTGKKQPVVTYCHAGCSTAAVLEALGLTWSDISTKKKKRSSELGELTGTYLYCDEQNKPLYRTLRFSPKGFRQQRHHNGQWVNGLDGVRRVLYRLPAVLATIKAGETVWIVEGEKDADRLRTEGVAATCNPMGAGKWRDDYSQSLTGGRAVLVVDRDEPGYAHALQVAASLERHGIDVTIVQPAAGKDASDHLAAGHGLDEFQPLTLDQLRQLADPGDINDDGKSEAGGSQASRLVALAQLAYRIVQGTDGRTYAVDRNGPPIALSLRGRDGLRTRLARDLFARNHEAASGKALTDTLAVLEGIATTQEPEPVALRVARTDTGAIAVDLGTVDGQCALVEPAGWRLDLPPGLFRRTTLTAPLPAPVRGGSLDVLAELVNVDPAGFRLIVGWLIAALLPDIPHPILCLFGEQGTAKTTAARLLVSAIDPSPAPLRSSPRDARSWAVTASASWVIALDNVSEIPQWFSDTLCKAVTGEGFLDRALFTDDDVTVLSFRRVIALTSIDAGHLAGDLAERLLPIELTPIRTRDRRTDTDISRHYEQARPAILGALLDLLAQVLAVLPTVELDELPRMADFARTLAAVDRVTGWTTLPDYLDAAAGAAETVLESNPVADAIIRLAQHGHWTGTAGELLAQLDGTDPNTKPPALNARQLAGILRRLAPALRGQGIFVDFTRSNDSDRRRLITLRADRQRQDEQGEQFPNSPSGPSGPSGNTR